jgi:hypothetical protein
LAERGLKVDSSVYKGGLWRQHNLDYRPALRNGHFWRFSADTNVPDPKGYLLEFPILTRMVPTWTMFTSKRVSMQRSNSSAVRTGKKVLNRLKDFLRLRYPLKFDLGETTQEERTRMLEAVIREDRKDPATFRPIVAIGHTKDLIDSDKVESILAFLKMKGIKVSVFPGVYHRCNG